MRPLRLELEGFTSFRDPTTLDLSEARYFALVGPTGSGKSSIIDAMIFALYGKVPRLDARSVFPVINQGSNEARVRLTFALGESEYTAVRVVRRTGPDRATTREARLERGDEVLAGDADGLTAEVERILGLTFEQFTRCVVLPQGDFARFMHDQPSARQDLLIRLLGLEVYERMMQRANQRAATAEAELGIQRRRLEEDLSFATAEDLARTRAALEEVDRLREQIAAEEPTLEDLRERVRAARQRERAATDALRALGTVQPPEDIGALAAAVTEARAELERLESEADAADDRTRATEEALAAMPARAAIERALAASQRRAALEAQRAGADATLSLRVDEADAAATAATAAELAATNAARVLDALRTEHRAHDLARTLRAGDPCPVCRRTVEELPTFDALPAIEEAERGLEGAEQAQRAARKKAGETAADLAAAKAISDSIVAQLAAVAGELDGAPAAADAEAILAALATAEADVAGAREAAKRARAAATRARAAIGATESQLLQARRALDATRDGLATLSPPPLGHHDIGADWETLRAWAAGQLDVQREHQQTAAREAGEAEEQGTALVTSQRAACERLGIEPGPSPRDDVVAAAQRLRSQVERIEEALETAKALAEEIERLQGRSVVARELANHLKAANFERWVLAHALSTLVEGATAILLELSGGQYSLALDRNTNFAVVDHRNANLTRSARTLSGGETFLASLSLALALSDRIASLSANSAVRLESILLDEGFGTLDPETLEVVAAAIENLSSLNRVVGIVTHVRDLAERVPLRFEVRKGPTSSRVEQVWT